MRNCDADRAGGAESAVGECGLFFVGFVRMQKSFDEVFVDCTKHGTKLKTDDYCASGKHIIVDQGQEQVAGYTNLEEGIFFDVPAIIFGDHTRIIKYVAEPFFLGADGVKVLRCSYDNANYKYLYYALKNVRIPNTGYNRHYKWLKEARIPYPDVSAQAKIVNVLDLVTSIINHRKQELSALDDLIKARFVEMFGDFKTNPMGWPVVGFEEIAVIDGNMTTDYEKYADYPHIGIDSIEKETGLLKGYRTVSEDGVISGKYVFTSAHIIYSKIRPNLNKVALPEFDGLCSADAYPILPIMEKCTRVFLAYDMRSKFFLEYILQFCNRTNLPKVNRKEVSGFRTPLPPIELQNTFAAFVAQIDKSKSAIQKSLTETQTLFDSLMQQYFG